MAFSNCMNVLMTLNIVVSVAMDCFVFAMGVSMAVGMLVLMGVDQIAVGMFMDMDMSVFVGML